MPVEEQAAAVVDSATTQPVAPAFDPSNQHTWSEEQRAEWNKSGEIPKPKSAESATAKKEQTEADSSTAEKEKAADSASDSATDKEAKPHLKTKEDTDRRFREILDELKAVRQQNEELRRAKTSETRDTKQESQPAAEVYKPLNEKEYFKANPDATYEDFVRAAAKHEAKWEVKQEIAAENQRRAYAEAQKELNARVEEAKKRYPDYQQRIEPAVKAIVDDQQIPYAVKAIVNDSPVFTDLIYVLADPASLADLIQTAKTNPAAAIRKIVLTEQLVQTELAKAKEAGTAKTDGVARDADTGKFVKSEVKESASEPKPRAPKPPSEVGGRGTAAEDALAAAAKAGDFRSFEAEQNRRLRATS
jgi:hypothetical protein